MRGGGRDGWKSYGATARRVASFLARKFHTGCSHRSRRFLRLDEPDLQRVAGEARDIVEVQLAHEIGAMVVHGLHADAELGGNLAGAMALGHELEDLALAGGEEVVRVAAGGVGDDVA